MIRILRSSAGSGKTFNLAKTYIRLLLSQDDRYAYRHILAVTFTNKATAEMKNRILKELDILTREPEKSAYINEFSKEFGGIGKVQDKSARVLRDILHDYSAFAVSTIDKFFQQTLRAFARELGQFSSYQIELDKDALVRESADRILDSIGSAQETPGVRKWLREALLEQLSQKEKMSLEAIIHDNASRLMSDELREVLEANGLKADVVFSRDFLDAVRKGCHGYIASYKKERKAAAQAILDAIYDCGLQLSDFSRSKITTYKIEQYAVDIDKALATAPSATLKNWASDPETWFTKANTGKFLPLVSDKLRAAAAYFHSLIEADASDYNTAKLLSGQVYTLGLASELEKQFKALMEEKNVISIDESNVTLRDIIAGSDAPFIYEKLGVRFQDFLLDEFQDTSRIQWENFYPLLAESEASGGSNLLVGDVKQSIYRWRGGDWHLLANDVKKAFPKADDSRPLKDNWRSRKAIVEFNNAFFDFAAKTLDLQLGGTVIEDIYADSSQIVKCKDKADGSVRIEFYGDREQQFQAILSSVSDALESGFSYGDIAVLVRKNKEGSAVAERLLQNGIPVISDDSMRVKSSVTLRRLVSLLYCVQNGQDKINRYLTDSLDIELPDHYDSLYSLAEELLRRLRVSDEALFDGEVLYIQSFMDVLLAWYTANGNSLSSFLEYWEEQDTKISSPEGTDSVRVLTVHKSKGLEFPYVILPFAGMEPLFDSRHTSRWCVPEGASSGLGSFARGVFDVKLSDSTKDTLFADTYRQERVLQFIDSINTFYVAMTRAERVLHVITSEPRDKNVQVCKSFSELLYIFVSEKRASDLASEENYFSGRCPKNQFSPSVEALRTDALVLHSTYPTWPIRGRMRVGGDAREYFARGEGDTELPTRLKGIVMHKILSDVTVASDLPAAVERAVASGLADAALAPHYLALLQTKLSEVSDLHWFETEPHDQVGGDDPVPSIILNEADIIGADGSVNRPDRVVIGKDGDVTVIDYKFGSEHPGYAAQIRRYCSLFKAMGYPKVEGWLWYVSESKTEKII